MNESIFLFLNQLAGISSWSDWLILFLAEFLGWVLVGMLIIHYVDHHQPKRVWRELGVVLAAAALSWILVMIIKFIYATSRPFIELDDVNQLIFTTRTSSFPSGHTAFFVALGAALTRYHRRLGTLYLGLALVIGLARVTAGIHWPVDILAGAAMGALIGLAATSLARTHRVAK